MKIHTLCVCFSLVPALVACQLSATPAATLVIQEIASTPAATQALVESTSTPGVEEITPTPEIYIPLIKAVPYIELDQAKIVLGEAVMSNAFPLGCSGQPPACTTAKEGYRYIVVSFKPLDLPEGQMLPYKSVPASVGIKDETGSLYPTTLRSYDNTSRLLTLGFEVPASASTFVLQWPGYDDLPLNVIPGG